MENRNGIPDYPDKQNWFSGFVVFLLLIVPVILIRIIRSLPTILNLPSVKDMSPVICHKRSANGVMHFTQFNLKYLS